MFTLEQLQTLILVNDTGSVSQAARTLGKSKGAVSLAISALEDELGYTLFDRSGWKLELTEFGQKVLGDAHILNRQIAKIQSYTEVRDDTYEPVLKIGLHEVIPILEFQSIFEQFQQRFPHTSIQVLRLTEEESLEGLQTGKLDIYIRLLLKAKPPIDCESATIKSMPFVFACAPDGELTNTDISSSTQLMNIPQVILDLRDSAENEAQQLSTEILLAATREDQLYWVEMDAGWCMLPKSVFEERQAIGSLMQFYPKFERRPISQVTLDMLYSIKRPESSAFNWLVEALSDEPTKSG
ncbi:LysR family transcriptional regulator [Vibrio tapetis subsp. quintayensis]|uniref:LysR family transcriptional regulator n=1 Tax=Vibrio tapetis TaxID=52443 RepID=UPI0025B45946|nr:LysR family transcriptional regulator [Vibrio tapetis]MDN3680872.1 LysR family transcriptional regulator [Vibrio tapetis subsp. quintayensis]